MINCLVNLTNSLACARVTNRLESMKFCRKKAFIALLQLKVILRPLLETRADPRRTLYLSSSQGCENQIIMLGEKNTPGFISPNWGEVYGMVRMINALSAKSAKRIS
jgi:hypothetical protein